MANEAIKDMTGMQQYPAFIRPFQESVQRSAEAKSELAGLERGMETQRTAERQQALGRTEEEFARKVREAPQRQQLVEIETQLQEPFIPVRENAQNLATLFALVNIAGFAMGAGGKRNSQAAMAGMNGMLEGYRKGRTDLYKKEKDVFDTNIKQLKLRYDTLDRQLKDALETYKTDKQAGLRQAEIAYAEAGANFYKQYADKFGLAAAYEFHKQAYENANRMWTEKNREEERADRLRRQAESEARAVRREERAETRFERMIQKATTATSQKKEGKPLPDKQVRDIEGLSSLEDGLIKLAKDFKPQYAQFGMPLGFGAEQMAEFRRRLGDKESQAAISWWSSYERMQAPNRHALFGATLTGNELKNYQAYTAKKSDAPDTVQTLLTDQLNFVRNSAANKIMTAEAAGYRVPEVKAKDYLSTYSGTSTTPTTPTAPAATTTPAAPAAGIEAQARTAFGSYEPDKYDYRISPEGKVQRKRKE